MGFLSAAFILVAAAHFFYDASLFFVAASCWYSDFLVILSRVCLPSIIVPSCCSTIFQIGITPAILLSPSLSPDEHSRPADLTCSQIRALARLAPAFAPTSTSHRTLLLCCPCRADPTQPSNTFHMTACTRILPIHTAGRRRDPEPSHQRACSSFYTDAPPLCVTVSHATSFPL
jgi:hypothetical protein